MVRFGRCTFAPAFPVIFVLVLAGRIFTYLSDLAQ
jgi:hypothetical protein